MPSKRLDRFPIQLALAAFLAAAGAGCATHPESLKQHEMTAFASDRVARVTAGQEAMRGPVSLHEAMARALKYNLDTRVEMAQTALKIKELDLSEYKLLPSIVAGSGYAGRDNTSASVSQTIATRRISTDYTSSTDRSPLTADLTLSWNVLDFGLSYVRAQQLGDEALIAAEARRKVANRVIEDTRTAYWRAVTYQRLIARLRGLEGRVVKARAAARTLYNEGQTQPMLALAYERELVEVRREIQKVEGDLIAAKAQLAALMNVEPGSPFTLVDARSGNTLALKLPPDQLVGMALQNRPEVREVAYRMRINQKEATAALLELLPGAQLYLGGNFDGSKFLLNNNWLAYGAKASWNLMKIVHYPARKELIDAQDNLLDQRSLALTMAIMTQVHVSRARYAHAQRELHTAADYLNVQNDILAQIRSQAATDRTGEQALIREEMNSLLAEVRFDLAHAQLQNAFASVYSSLGLDPFDQSIDLDASVGDVSTRLQALWRKRGDAVGLKNVGLLRAPRPPRPIAVGLNAPATPGAAGQGLNKLLPPMPAPGSASRSLGGTFIAPRPPGAPLTTQTIPQLPATVPPDTAAVPPGSDVRPAVPHRVVPDASE